jgi:hypothetical protein
LVAGVQERSKVVSSTMAFSDFRGLLEITADGVFLGKTPNNHSCSGLH